MYKEFCCTSASSSVGMLVMCFCALWVLCLCCCLTDWLQRTMMETNPYLLGLTVVVTIVHSVFEFLAFKNGMYFSLQQWLYDVNAWWICTYVQYLCPPIADIQFWRTRESLAGLSVRSVFFNVFQSLIVLLYILDSETNFVIIISCFIGLLIEVWKITKVCKVSLNTENCFLGVIPRISLTDQPSYVESSTKEYDRVSMHASTQQHTLMYIVSADEWRMHSYVCTVCTYKYAYHFISTNLYHTICTVVSQFLVLIVHCTMHDGIDTVMRYMMPNLVQIIVVCDRWITSVGLWCCSLSDSRG